MPYLLITSVYLYFFICYLISIKKKDFSLFDLAWATGLLLPLALAAFFTPPLSTGKIILVTLVLVWAVRLTSHLSMRYRTHGKDRRYQKMESSWGNRWQLHGFFKVFLIQATLAWIIILPEILYLLLDHKVSIGPLSLVGIVVALIGFRIEAIADSQLADFKNDPSHPPFLQEGLWKYSRHPNYVGEVLFWWGVWIFCSAHVPIWTVISPLTLHLLIRYVSGVPLVEEQWKKNPAFAAYAASVPVFWPFFKANKDS